MMSGVPTQSEMVFADQDIQRDPDFYFATRAISQMQRELIAQKRHVVGIASRWMFAYEYVQELHDRLLTGDQLEIHKRFFYSTVPVMFGLGRLLLARLDSCSAELKAALGYSIADIEACVRNLEEIDRAEQREWSPQQKECLETLLGRGGIY